MIILLSAAQYVIYVLFFPRKRPYSIREVHLIITCRPQSEFQFCRNKLCQQDRLAQPKLNNFDYFFLFNKKKYIYLYLNPENYLGRGDTLHMVFLESME